MKRRFIKALKRDKYLYLMFFPVFVYYIIFHYIPIPGLVLAFKEYKPGGGIYGGGWIGFENFKLFFGSVYAFRLIRNTLLLSLYSLIFGFPVPILFAICVLEIRNMKVRRTVQSVSYLPYFISTVVLVGMLRNIFDDRGLVNEIITGLGGTRVNFFLDPKYFRPLYVGSGIWKDYGFHSIIYISTIMSVDPTLYESAKIDGISKFGEVRYITIPMIVPTIVILFIMQLGRVMNVGFEKVFLLYSSAVYETGDVISTYIYRKGIENSDYSFSTAVGLFNNVINFMLVFCANTISRKLTNTGLW
jgi:putative aldouronate transport system permease protein